MCDHEIQYIHLCPFYVVYKSPLISTKINFHTKVTCVDMKFNIHIGYGKHSYMEKLHI